MIVFFVIAYGEDHIRLFFERSLPSLLTAGNLPAVAHLKPELLFCTRKEDFPLISRMGGLKGLNEIFGDRIVLAGVPPGMAEFQPDLADSEDTNAIKLGHHRRLLSHFFLCRAASVCVKRNATFVHLSPDFVYADSTVANAWTIHRLTGKTISVFNGRVGINMDESQDFDQSLQEAITQPYGILKFFGRNMIKQWHHWSTSDPDTIPTDDPGILLYKSGEMTHIFSSAPNPLMGKFTKEDIVYFSANRFTVWDHDWQDMLFDQRRLFVQTNLDLGMSIEIESLSRDHVRDKFTSSSVSFGALMQDMYTKTDGIEDILEARRYNKFSTKMSSFSFSTNRI